MITNFHTGKETTSGVSETLDQPGLALVGLFVNITEISGMLTQIVVTLQHSPDGEVWYNAGNISVTRTNTGAVVSSPAALALVADYVRVIWTITGADPSVTFTADLVAQKVR